MMEETRQRISDPTKASIDLMALQSKDASPIMIGRVTLAVSGGWSHLYTVPDGSIARLVEIRLYNGSSGDTDNRVVVISSSETNPSGAGLPAGCILSKTLGTDEYHREELSLGLRPGFEVWAYTSAAEGDVFTCTLSAVLFTRY